MKLKNWFLLGAVLFGVCLAQNSLAEIIIPAEGSIRGKLIDEETGHPVTGCRVALYSIISEYQTMGLESHTDIQPATQSFPFVPIHFPARFPVAVTYSSGSGDFSFVNLWTGHHHYEIEIQDPKYQNEAVTGPFSAGSNDWGVIEASKRPFYFSASGNDAWGSHQVVRTTVVNTTGKKAYMRFWLTGRLERLDDSEYFGCNSEVVLKLKRRKKGTKTYATYRLNPGENAIKLRIKDYGPNIDVSQIMINGGRSSSKPMMVSTYVLRHVNIIGPPVIMPPPIITNLPPIIIPGLTNIYPRPVIPTNPPITIPPYTTFSGAQSSLGVAIPQ